MTVLAPVIEARIVAGILWAGVTTYALLGGADFGGGFWDLRKALGREKADRLMFEAWKGMHLPEKGDIGPGLLVKAIEDADKALNSGDNLAKVREIFGRRKLDH